MSTETHAKATPDLILHRGLFVTLDRKNPTADAVAIKDGKFKVQAAIQGDELRVTGKKRDDLQEVIAHVRSMKIEQPLQFKNFRD